MDLREQIRTTMGGRQWGVAFLCFLMAIVDGYETLVMALVAPTIAADWGLDNVTMGYLLSSTVFGMAAGALFLAPMADRIGRRNFIIFCMILAAVGNAFSGLAGNVPLLIIARVFTGLFIGALVPILNTLVSEYSSDRKRATVMGIYGTGLPLGVVLGGSVTGWLVGSWGWPGPFYFSALLSFALGVLAFFTLPESVEYLVQRRPAHALQSYNRIAAKFGHAPADELPAARGHAADKKPLKSVFTGTFLRRTVFLWSGYSLVVGAFYFANTWTPTLIARATGNAADGRTASILISVGGILGSLGFAATAAKWNGRAVTASLLLLGLPVYILFSFTYTSGLSYLSAVLVGIVTIGGMQALYAISPYVYPAATRGTALGFMLAAGRGVSIVVPILMGYLFAAGWTPTFTFQAYGVVVLAASILIYGLHRTYRGRTEDPDLVGDEDAGIMRPGDGASQYESATAPASFNAEGKRP
jgi:benzoate transport